jgi:hypothetical protein
VEDLIERQWIVKTCKCVRAAAKPHDFWHTACLTAQHAGQSLALCRSCQVIRDGFASL